MFQLICEAALRSTNPATGAAATAAIRRRGGKSTVPVAGSCAGSRALAGDVVASIEVVEQDEEDVNGDINIDQPTVAQKATKYRQWAQRPNVHVGLHYIDVFRRYGLPSLMVLPGESKHR